MVWLDGFQLGGDGYARACPSIYQERCQRGLLAHVGNVMGRLRPPGFDSLPLRHIWSSDA